MILNIYSKLTKEQEINDALKMAEYMEANTPGYADKKNQIQKVLMRVSRSGASEPFLGKKTTRIGYLKALYGLNKIRFWQPIFLNCF